MPTKALNIIVNRTVEHGHWVAKVKKSGDVVTVVFRQREEEADFFTRVSYAIRGYKNAGQLSSKYLAAMNLNYQNLPRAPHANYQQRTKSKPTNDQIDKKFKAASDNQDKNIALQSPTVRSPFIKSTSEFRLIRVTIKDEYKEQLKEQEREQKRQKFLDYLFNSVDSSTEQKLSENEKKHFRSELMPATDFVCGYFNREQWTDLELRLAISTLKFLETKAVLVDDDKKFINRLLESLSNELNELNLTA